MTEFLAEDNVCGQSLLQIVAVGNAIIAEILRVKDYIPELYRYVQMVFFCWFPVFSISLFCFRLEKKQDQIKYAEIILDFSYFKISEAQEKKIEENSVSSIEFIQWHNSA